jgi:exopolysaccharide production protein ExoZ
MVYTAFRAHLTPKMFLLRRLIRIYPIYWIMCAAYIFAHLFIGSQYNLGVDQILASALLVPPYSSYIIGPGWTLSFEMYFYICFALTLFAGPRRGLFLLSAFFFTSVLAGLIFAAPSPAGHVVTNALLLEFVAGAWLAYGFVHGINAGPKIGAGLSLSAVTLLVCSLLLGNRGLPSVVSWGVPATMLVAGILGLEPYFRSRAGRRIAALGDSSYLLYLCHILVLDLLLKNPFFTLSPGKEFAVPMSFVLGAICALAAAIGYRLVEWPLLVLMKRLVLHRPTRATRPSAATQ